MPVSVKDITKRYKACKDKYDSGVNIPSDVAETARLCLEFLEGLKPVSAGEKYVGGEKVSYKVYKNDFNGSVVISRPFRSDMFLGDKVKFAENWAAMEKAIDPKNHTLDYAGTNATLYTAILAFSIACDLHKKGVKAPGTFFEILLGGLLGALSGLKRDKHIKLPETPAQALADLPAPDATLGDSIDETGGKGDPPEPNLTETDELAQTKDLTISEDDDEILVQGKVTTDIVLVTPKDVDEIVIAAKISTRERGVQAWVHSRILEYYSEQGKLKRHRCLLVAVSETQRLKEGIQDTCIPRQIALYQKYVATMDCLYYLDPPPAYLKLDEQKIVRVRTISDFLSTDLASYLNPKGSNP